MSSDKPTFITTKAERNALNDAIDTDMVEERYRQLCCGRYEWSGLPDDVPQDFIETCLFYYGQCSARMVPGFGICIFASTTQDQDIYGRPHRWLPAGIKGIQQVPSMYTSSTNPVLYQGRPTIEIIHHWLELQKQAIRSLNQNLVAMSQPVLIEGLAGGSDLNGKMLAIDFKSGRTFLPVVEKSVSGMGVEVLDLHANDYTSNLYATIRNMHDEICDQIAVMNGNVKTSGTNPIEQLADSQSVNMNMDKGLQLRKDWCRKINAVLGTNFDVKKSDSWEIPFQAMDEVADNDAYENGDDSDE